MSGMEEMTPADRWTQHETITGIYKTGIIMFVLDNRIIPGSGPKVDTHSDSNKSWSWRAEFGWQQPGAQEAERERWSVGNYGLGHLAVCEGWHAADRRHGARAGDDDMDTGRGLADWQQRGARPSGTWGDLLRSEHFIPPLAKLDVCGWVWVSGGRKSIYQLSGFAEEEGRREGTGLIW